MKVVCCGDCGADVYLPSGETHLGGITANFARHARREFAADDEIAIVAPLGNDEHGRFVREGLSGQGIECRFSFIDGDTPVQYIEIQADGEKDFVRYEEGVLRDFRISRSDRELVASSDLLVAPVFLQIVGLFDELMELPVAGLRAIDFADFVQDPDFSLIDRHVDAIDIGFFGLTMDESETIERIKSIAREHDKLFVVTLGEGGSIAFKGREKFECGALPVKRVVDTTGAGDAFAAAFLSRYCHSKSVSDSLSAGAELAAKVIQKTGTMLTE